MSNLFQTLKNNFILIVTGLILFLLGVILNPNFFTVLNIVPPVTCVKLARAILFVGGFVHPFHEPGIFKPSGSKICAKIKGVNPNNKTKK